MIEKIDAYSDAQNQRGRSTSPFTPCLTLNVCLNPDLTPHLLWSCFVTYKIMMLWEGISRMQGLGKKLINITGKLLGGPYILITPNVDYP